MLVTWSQLGGEINVDKKWCLSSMYTYIIAGQNNDQECSVTQVQLV